MSKGYLAKRKAIYQAVEDEMSGLDMASILSEIKHAEEKVEKLEIRIAALRRSYAIQYQKERVKINFTMNKGD